MVDSRSRKEKLEAKLRRLKAKILQEVLEPQKVILVVIVLYFGLCFFGSIPHLSRNWALQQQIIEKETELAYLSLQVDNIELENDYYSSEEYQELAARKLQNKKLSGENLVYLPNNTEDAKNKHKEYTLEQQQVLNEQPNYAQWMRFLFGV